MLTRITIGAHERGFLHKGRDYERYLQPGIHWVWGFGRTLQRVDTTANLRFEHPKADVYLVDSACWADLANADLADNERALVRVNGRIHSVLGPGRQAFWQDLHELRADVMDVSKLRFEYLLLD